MPSPAPVNGNLITTIAAPYTTITLPGTASAADYIDYGNPNSYSFFGDFRQIGSNLVFSIVDPFANKSGTYTIPLLSASNAIEYFGRDNGPTNFATGVYKIAAPGDYRSNTSDSGLQVYGTDTDNVVYGLTGSTQSNALYGGSKNDTLISGNTKFAVFTGGAGSNTYVSGSGDNRYKIEVSDNGTHTIKAQGGNDIVQVLLPSANVDWSFKKVGNNLVGTIYGSNGAVSRMTIENQYTTGQVESILFYANGVSSTGATYAGFGLNDPGVGTYTGTAQAFVATSDDTTFNLQTTTRTSVRVFGNEGDDLMYAAPNATRVWFYAGDGIDTVVNSGLAANHTITISKVVNAASGRSINISTVTNANKLNADSYQDVERLKFSDKNIALDTGATQSAGQTALLIGAVLPGQLAFDVSKQALLGSVIGLFDQGFTLAQLSGAILRLPIWDVLTGKAAPTNADIATYLVNNAYSGTQTAAITNAAIAAMNAETPATQGNYLASLAAGDANQAHINLVGVQATGLVYLG
jgi:hypothetical protein